MLSDIFELFYARVRGFQYLHFLLHYVSIKRNPPPVLIRKDDKLNVQSEVYNYYPKDEAERVLQAIAHSVIYNRKTHLLKIGKDGNYIYEIDGTNADNFQNAVDKINKKKYQEIEFLNDV